MHPDIGTVVAGKYELCELAGEGGMATVWKGKMHGAAGFSRPVAVKKMKRQFGTLREYIDMFVEEARVGAAMQHPNIVQVLDFLQDDFGSYYLVLEWVEGIDLHQLVSTFRKAKHPLPWGLVAAVGIGGLGGLSIAHERLDKDGNPAPIVHRDVSPQNLLLSSRGEVKLADFGLALAKDRIAMTTMQGMVKGKLSYLSPEGVSGQKATAASDIFAMGTVLWEAVAGCRLFDGKDDLEVFKKVKSAEVPPLAKKREGLPQGLVGAIEKSLSVKPEDRFSSAREFAMALSELLGGSRNADRAQELLSQAVGEVKRWRSEEALLTANGDTPVEASTSWEDVEIEFSEVAKLPKVEQDRESLEFWFSKIENKIPSK
ncbi:MAG: serine/threonine protein kinase [Myxococcales bacterium]|nr:serine/threonine protein kinase [Myxococcales bacterium]